MSSSVVIVTVATANYLPAAFVLGDSIKMTCPWATFQIALIDKMPEDVEAHFPIIQLEEIFPGGCEDYIAKIGLFGFAMLSKPAVLQYVLGNYSEIDTFIYIDSDCFVAGDLTRLINSYSGEVMLTPHNRANENAPDFFKTCKFLRYGQFNAGFLAVRRGVVADSFLKWWRMCIETQCSSSELSSSYVDQGYLDIVPYAFSGVCILNVPGLNLGYWNLNNQLICEKSNGWFLNDCEPLYLFHFSGYSPDRPEILSSFDPRPVTSIDHGLSRLSDNYAKSIKKYRDKGVYTSWIKCRSIEIHAEKNLYERTLRHLLLRVGWWLVKHFDPAAKLMIYSEK
jgi:hypothetical protein